jgi:hypothetical protein
MLQQYQHLVNQLGVTIATSCTKDPYNPPLNSNEMWLNTNAMVRYFSTIGVTTTEAEEWQAWATAYVDMELNECPNSAYAPQLRQVRDQVRACINSDPSWVLRVHVSCLGHYNPAAPPPQPQPPSNTASITHHATPHIQAAADNTEAGPSSITHDGDARVPLSDGELEDSVSLGYDDEDEDSQMGPA